MVDELNRQTDSRNLKLFLLKFIAVGSCYCIPGENYGLFPLFSPPSRPQHIYNTILSYDRFKHSRRNIFSNWYSNIIIIIDEDKEKEPSKQYRT